MKKTIIAAAIAASAVFGTQAFAAANLTILGSVTDSKESCDVEPGPTIDSGVLTLSSIGSDALDALAVNTPDLVQAKAFSYVIKNCMQGAKDYTGKLNVAVTGDYAGTLKDVLFNSAASDAAKNAAVTVLDDNGAVKNGRIDFTGATPTVVDFTAGKETVLKYKAAYVKTAAGVTDGNVKGVAVFTVSY